MVKPDNVQAAKECFHHTQIKITMQGAEILGVALGVRPFVEKLVHDNVACWVNEVKQLSGIAQICRQAAYAVFTMACPVNGAFSCVPFQILGPSCIRWRMQSGSTLFQ